MNLSYEVLALMFPGRENILTVGQHGWREVYEYNNNGNRITKVTPWGKIEYAYDAENRLVSKGRITYQYDQDGNLLYVDLWGLENVYFIYTFSDSTKDRWMKRFERGTINDDVKYLEEKGLTVAVIESGTKQDVINAINDPEAIVVVTSGHGDRTGIVTADGGRFRPSDVDRK